MERVCGSWIRVLSFLTAKDARGAKEERTRSSRKAHGGHEVKLQRVVLAVLVGCMVLQGACAQNAPAAKAKKSSATTATAKLKSTADPLQGLEVAPDLKQRIDRLKLVRMPFDSKGMTANEVAEVKALVHATQLLDDIYWRQVDPKAIELYKQLTKGAAVNPCVAASSARSGSSKDAQVACYLLVNGSRYDLYNDNKPFIGTEPAPPGHAFYPEDLKTAQQVEEYVKAHPEQKDAIYSPYNVVRWSADHKTLETVPYHVGYAQWLKPAAESLRKAAKLSPDSAFAKFLNARADALEETDDYYASDVQWLDLKDPKIDVIMAPYETYDDELLGVKATYGPSVLVRDEAESAKLATFQKYVADIQDALPVEAAYRPSVRGKATPMEVVNAPYRGGDLRHGYQAVADNLPNDARIHAEKGTKKMFFKNFMDARVNYVILPLAKQVMDAQQAVLASGAGYLASTMMHEICHGLGPAFATVDGKQADIRESIGPAFGALEEAKADVVGMFALEWLIDKGVLPEKDRVGYDVSEVAGIFRTVRFGAGEAHARAEMMEFNYYAEQGGIVRTSNGRYRIDPEKLHKAYASLAKELLEIEATGDRERNERWFAKYSQMPAELKQTLDRVKGVPIDVNPVFEFAGEKPE